MNLKTTTNNVEKFEKAAKLADVQITDRTNFANGTSVVVLKFRRPDQLINLGMFYGMEEAKPITDVKAEVTTVSHESPVIVIEPDLSDNGAKPRKK